MAVSSRHLRITDIDWGPLIGEGVWSLLSCTRSSATSATITAASNTYIHSHAHTYSQPVLRSDACFFLFLFFPCCDSHEGFFGRVYKAHHRAANRTIVLKELKRYHGARDVGMLKRGEQREMK